MFKAYRSGFILLALVLVSLLFPVSRSPAESRGIRPYQTYQKKSAAEKRTALVIGNWDYQSSPLRNPEHDSADIAAVLTELGFEVNLKQNVGRREFRRAIRDFGRSIRDGGVGLFYYAGHGMQVNGRNYLIPVGAEILEEDEVIDEAVEANSLLRKMARAENQLNIVVLDACRNNPFARSFRSANKGLARMDAPTGTLIAYATSPGSVAADGSGRNSPYTRHLIQEMRQPGVPIEQVFKRVRKAVLHDTDNRQTPWEASSLTGDFIFKRAPKTQVAALGPANQRKKVEKPLPSLESLLGDFDRQPDNGTGAKVSYLLRQATMDVQADRLFRPFGNNAVEKFRKILSLDPGNEQATRGLKLITRKMVSLARIAIARAKWKEAENYLDDAASIDPDYPEIATVKEELKSARSSLVAMQRGEGCIIGDCQNGTGTLVFQGNKYEGGFKNGKMHGRGVMLFKRGGDGDVLRYEGDFKNGAATGMGSKYFKGGHVYTGEVVDGNAHGQGTLTFENGQKYVGSFLKNELTGTGIMFYPDGSKYTGEFRNGKVTGSGTAVYADRSRYTGEFLNGKMHGHGTHFGPDGKVTRGFFEEDRLVTAGVSAGLGRDRSYGVGPGIDEGASRVQPVAPVQTHRLTVRSNVNNDRVFINGKAFGKTRLDVELPEGIHTVRVEKPGYVAWEKEVRLRKNRVVRAKLYSKRRVKRQQQRQRQAVQQQGQAQRPIDPAVINLFGGFLNAVQQRRRR